MSEEENTPTVTEINTKDMEEMLDFNTFTTLIKDLLLNPILLDESVNDRIMRFSKDLGEIKWQKHFQLQTCFPINLNQKERIDSS